MGGRIAIAGILASACACSFDAGFGSASTPGGGDSADGGRSGDAAAVVGCEAWDPEHFDPCTLSPSQSGLELVAPGTYVYDTDAESLVDPDGQTVAHASNVVGDLVIVSADSITIGSEATLRGVGSRPLVLASQSTLVVSGNIDVSSAADSPGAGANPTVCGSSAAGGGESDVGGAGGGGGGGFGAVGGKGGDGDSNENAGNDGISIGGVAGEAAASIGDVRGGCPGGDGGEGQPGKRGIGGAGGGAILLAAAVSVQIDGMVSAGGCGGLGDDQDAGGGGGGSGGFIGLDAPSVDAAGGTLAANGGGGAGGGDDGVIGEPGENGKTADSEAIGGVGSSIGGTSGAPGGHRASPPGKSVTAFDTGAGGGGGGGVGVIAVWSAAFSDAGTTVTPAAQTP